MALSKVIIVFSIISFKSLSFILLAGVSGLICDKNKISSAYIFPIPTIIL